MRTVIFLAPFLMDATLKYIQAVNAVAGVRLYVLTQDGAARLPPGAQHYRVEDALNPKVIVEACQRIRAHTGSIHRLMGILENAQEVLAIARAELGLPGMDLATAERFRDKGVMKQALRDAGLPCARYARLHSAADARKFVAEVGYPVVLKPTPGATKAP